MKERSRRCDATPREQRGGKQRFAEKYVTNRVSSRGLERWWMAPLRRAMPSLSLRRTLTERFRRFARLLRMARRSGAIHRVTRASRGCFPWRAERAIHRVSGASLGSFRMAWRSDAIRRKTTLPSKSPPAGYPLRCLRGDEPASAVRRWPATAKTIVASVGGWSMVLSSSRKSGPIWPMGNDAPLTSNCISTRLEQTFLTDRSNHG